MLFDLKTFFTTFLETCIENKEWTLIGLSAVLLVYWLHRHRIKNLPIKTSSNELGELFVSRQAILSLIHDVGTDRGIGRIKRISLKDKKNALEVRLHVFLNANQSFDQVSVQLQESIQKVVLGCLGVIKTVRVDIVLDGIEKLPKEREAMQEFNANNEQ